MKLDLAQKLLAKRKRLAEVAPPAAAGAAAAKEEERAASREEGNASMARLAEVCAVANEE